MIDREQLTPKCKHEETLHKAFIDPIKNRIFASILFLDNPCVDPSYQMQENDVVKPPQYSLLDGYSFPIKEDTHKLRA